MHAQRLEIVLADGRDGNIAVAENGDLGPVGGMDGEGDLVIDRHRADIGDVLHAEQRELGGADRTQILDSVHGSQSFQDAPLVVIFTWRIGASTTRRLRSISRRPFSSRAPSTSIPSASTKER